MSELNASFTYPKYRALAEKLSNEKQKGELSVEYTNFILLI